MPKQETTTRKYGEIKIRLNDTMCFDVEWPEGMAGDSDRSYASYALACEAIDRREKVRSAVKREKLALPVITSDGQAANLTGIHAGHGRFLTSPDLKNTRWNTNFYPDTPLVRQLLSEEKRAEEELSRLHGELFKFQLAGDSYSRQRLSVPENLAALKADYAAKLELAS